MCKGNTRVTGVPGTVQECFSTELLCKGQSLTGIIEIAEQARGWERGSTIMMLSQKSCRSRCQSAEDEMGDHFSVAAQSEREM